MSVVLDTTVLVDVLRGDPAATTFLLDLAEAPYCSELTRAEVLIGLRSAERRPAERLFGVLGWVPVHEGITRQACDYGRRFRRSHRLAVTDLVIAATATELALPLATSNTKHYPMFPKLKPPY